MKNLKLTLSLFVVLALLSGLFVKGLNQNSEISESEFIFDTLCTINVYSKKDRFAIAHAFDDAARLHSLADFFDTDSDISRINNAKSDQSISVDPDTMNMLILAKDIYEKSEGAFDITTAPISKLWRNFKEDLSDLPDNQQISAQLKWVNQGLLVLDPHNLTVTKKSDHTQLDLGGIAKGYAADKAAEILKSCGVDSALIDFGGNIVTVGKNPKTANGQWRIGLQTPFAPTGEYSKIIELDEGQAAVTSGTYQRYFELNGVKYHHILDPKTGYPAKQDYESVTVISDSAALADCLATAIFVKGRDLGQNMANESGAKAYFLP